MSQRPQARRRILILLSGAALLGGYFAYQTYVSQGSAALAEAPQEGPRKKKKQRPGIPASDTAAVRATRAARAAADSAKPGPRGADAPADEDSEAAAAELNPDQMRESYEFARVTWERPHSKALAAEVNRLDRGFDGRPRGRFHLVQGDRVFMRASLPVNFSPERRLDKVPESAIGEFLPEWYQRGFSLHFRGNSEPFSPLRFRLEELPARMADTALPPQERLVHYAVHAYVDRPGGVLIYPDASRREGANGYTEASELKVESADPLFSAGYFRNLTRGPIESIQTYAFPDRAWRLVQVRGRRDVPDPAGAALRGRRGTWIFLIKPEEKEVAFLAHDFDARHCLPDKDIRFMAMLDLGGDEAGELLLGPRPAIIVHEDGEGVKYHFEEGQPCRHPVRTAAASAPAASPTSVSAR